MDKVLCVWVVAQYCALMTKNMLSLDVIFIFMKKSDFKALSKILGVNSGLL
jgi:hypothetical protein